MLMELHMYDDVDDDRTDWEINLDNAMQEHLNKVVPGLAWDEIPKELLAEAEREALKVVGPKPKD